MINLEQFAGNPEIDFAGLSSEDQVSLLGELVKVPHGAKKIAVVKKIAGAPVAIPGNNSRAEFMRRKALLPKEIQDALNSGRAQLVDAVYYWHKAASAVSSKKMILAADTEAAGVTNVNNAKLPKDAWFLLDAIILQSGVNATLSSTAFGDIAAAIANGEFEIKADGKLVMPRQSCEIFKRGTAEKAGLYKLENPKLIEPEKVLECEVTFSEASVANTNIRLAFKGSVVVPF
ncbi:MAG: hypothetical protein WAQ28_03470 [Bacteroidia bacterium]